MRIPAQSIGLLIHNSYAVDFHPFKSQREELRFYLTGELRCGHTGFDIASQEDMEDVVGDHNQQPDHLNGVEVVFVEMIGMPFIGQLVETLVFDVPSMMGEVDKVFGGNGIDWQCRDP